MTSSPGLRPFRFGLILDSRTATRDGVVGLARRAEAAGIGVLLGTDHLGRWAALPLLQSAAEATRLRIGTFVLNNDLRHPAVLAQELTTIDAITGGRLEIGIGAGWNRVEYDAAGLSFNPPAVRVARMQASLRMLKQAMSEGRIDHPGDDAYPAMHQRDLPTSVQRPHPPFMVGGGGPRVLRFAAREADIVGLDPRSLPGGGADPDRRHRGGDRSQGGMDPGRGRRAIGGARAQHRIVRARSDLPAAERPSPTTGLRHQRGRAASQSALPRRRLRGDGRDPRRPPRALGHQLHRAPAGAPCGHVARDRAPGRDLIRTLTRSRPSRGRCA
ncbi:MAG: LLM class flavin-dependent oxidoreductase [Chloroflexi bacterium]|nr:LLM class flavin-dependent oxidoreductase [Chloroflexota bacterium]